MVQNSVWSRGKKEKQEIDGIMKSPHITGGLNITDYIMNRITLNNSMNLWIMHSKTLHMFWESTVNSRQTADSNAIWQSAQLFYC